MRKTYNILTLIFFLFLQISYAQKTKTDANVVGHVINTEGDHIPFATVIVVGTTIGTTTGESGHYRLINLPEGSLVIQAKSLGYKPKEAEVVLKSGETKVVKFELEKDVLGLEEVVVTANRNETNRKESSVIVNTITPKVFNITQSVTLSEGLNFCSGLRMESNCQNCGFSQVRMNGMEGPYSQILINSRPVFSGLAAVYGLELIPSNMIERVEVVRGGGSALYGSNAIAGTINLILRDPINNSYEFDVGGQLVGVGIDNSGKPAKDYNVQFNSSLVGANNKSGISIYGYYRDREPFDANDDGFSELTSINNTTIGSHAYHRIGRKSKLEVDFFNIKEKRRGGNKFDEPPHMAGIAEAVEHNITNGAVTFEQHIGKDDLLSVYAAGQRINRDSYYGANKSLSDYGNTNDFSYSLGAQYNASFGKSKLMAGIEDNGEWLVDKKLAYPDIDNASINFDDSTITISDMENVTIADQTVNTLSIFAQYELQWKKLKVSAGARFDNYNISERVSDEPDHSNNVISPRLTLKYDFTESLQARVSYSQGYRAPQIFDEDLHIETSGARQVIHKNSPDLQQETSHSYMASVDYNKQLGKTYVGLLLEGFYTQLVDAFTNMFSEPDKNGTVIYTRINADKGAVVKGVNIEMNIVPSTDFSFHGGFTIQSSKYEEAQEFGEKNFFRTPNDYGYFTIDWKFLDNMGISASGNYTGKMFVPYFGDQIQDPDEGELRETGSFFDLGIKLRYCIRLNGSTLKLYTGVKNIFNSYQDDFDRGIDRDPGYIYGPMNPRTIYIGVKFGNTLRL